ncbi:MAG: hypothetical protein M1368_02280 [Thaumarchaeota archaeon]|nr:hypothetical protein [Nitrososphaerota archaeon]
MWQRNAMILVGLLLFLRYRRETKRRDTIVSMCHKIEPVKDTSNGGANSVENMWSSQSMPSLLY